MTKPKLYLSEGYSMKFDTISSMLQLVADSALSTHSRDWVKSEMGISQRMVGCIASYANATGLLKARIYKTTDFGAVIRKYDPYLSDVGTLWMMHYIASSNSELIIWNRLFNNILHEMPDGSLPNQYYSFFDDLQDMFTPATLKTNVPSELNSLINAYTLQQLSKLGLLSIVEGKVFRFYNQPIPSPVFYALILYYVETNYPGGTTIDFSFLNVEDNSPGRVCLFTPHYVRSLIEQLHKDKIIQLESRADLDQIRFIHSHSFVDILENYYRGIYG